MNSLVISRRLLHLYFSLSILGALLWFEYAFWTLNPLIRNYFKLTHFFFHSWQRVLSFRLWVSGYLSFDFTTTVEPNYHLYGESSSYHTAKTSLLLAAAWNSAWSSQDVNLLLRLQVHHAPKNRTLSDPINFSFIRSSFFTGSISLDTWLVF